MNNRSSTHVIAFRFPIVEEKGEWKKSKDLVAMKRVINPLERERERDDQPPPASFQDRKNEDRNFGPSVSLSHGPLFADEVPAHEQSVAPPRGWTGATHYYTLAEFLP